MNTLVILALIASHICFAGAAASFIAYALLYDMPEARQQHKIIAWTCLGLTLCMIGLALVSN